MAVLDLSWNQKRKKKKKKKKKKNRGDLTTLFYRRVLED